MTFRIEKLRRDHRVEGFDCGREPLNRFLIRFALQSQLGSSAQTYLALSDGEVIGYHTLTYGEVAYDGAPERLRKGVARHPVPLMILARLAVARTWAGRGLGAGLLKDALLRTLAAAEIAGLLRAFRLRAVAHRPHASVRTAEGHPHCDWRLWRRSAPKWAAAVSGFSMLISASNSRLL